MTIQCYKANGTAWGNGHVSDYSDEEYAYGIATGNGVKVYFTYTSTNGKLISGNMDICWFDIYTNRYDNRSEHSLLLSYLGKPLWVATYNNYMACNEELVALNHRVWLGNQ